MVKKVSLTLRLILTPGGKGDGSYAWLWIKKEEMKKNHCQWEEKPQQWEFIESELEKRRSECGVSSGKWYLGAWVSS